MQCIPRLVLRWLSLLTTTTPSVALQLHAALISENHVGEVVASVLPGKVQPLLLVDITYELAVGAPPESPPQ